MGEGKRRGLRDAQVGGLYSWVSMGKSVEAAEAIVPRAESALIRRRLTNEPVRVPRGAKMTQTIE